MGLKAELEKTVDELLNEILTDYQNQDPDIDVSQGSMTLMKSAALASASWGIRQGIKYALKQIFPDDADTENLEHHAGIFELVHSSDETDAELLERVLNRIRKPPAGGNVNDYETWAAAATTYVAKAYCYQIDPDIGSVGVLVLADEDATGSEQPSSHSGIADTNDAVAENKLKDSGATFVTSGVKKGDIVNNDDEVTSATVTAVDGEGELTLSADIFPQTGANYSIDSLLKQVKDYIMARCPVDIHTDRLSVFGPTITAQDVTMTATGGNKTQIKADIEVYMDALAPGEVLYVSRLMAIAIDNGATNVTVATPASDVSPASKEVLRPGTVTVN
jgi:uncharacterized phage protein gp47/JayE